jgi:hypothetical protein
VQNTLHVDVAESGSHTPYEYATDIINLWVVSYKTHWLACCTNGYYITSVTSRKVQTPGGPLAVILYAPGAQGGARGNAAASGLCPVMLFPVLLHGKNVTGRIFLPGVAQTDIQDNVLSASLLTAMSTMSTDLLATWALSVTGVNANVCIYNRANQVNTHVTIYRPSTKPGTQRRRYVPAP